MKTLPDGWKKYKIKDIGTVVTGNTPPKNEPENYDGDLPWIKPPDLDNGMFVSTSVDTISEFGRKKIRSLPKGSILVSCIGNIGKVAIAECELCTNQQINSIIPNKEIADSVFIYYAIKRIRPKLEEAASSFVVPLLNKIDFSNIELSIPPLPTQKKIAAVLEKAEKLREWRKDADGLTDRFLKSTFLEMFGDPVKNPKGWDVNKLQNLLKSPFVNGLYLPKERYVKIGGIEMVHMSDAFYGVVKRGSLKQVDINEKELKKYNIDHNDLLIARRSLNYEGSAKPCRVPQSNKPLVFESSLIKLSLNQNMILPIYLYYYLSNERAIKAFVLKYVTKSTISGINQSGLNKIEIVTPTIKLQNKFAGIVEKVEQMQVFQNQSHQHIDNLFNVLMQKAFRGELV